MADAGFIERATCPSCGHGLAHTVYACPYTQAPLWDFVTGYYPATKDRRDVFEGVDYRLDRCGRCELVFQRAIPSPPLMEELYDRWLNASYHPDKDPEYQHQVAHPAQARDGQELMTYAKWAGRAVEDLRVLDFGMGWGLWARVALGLGATVHGFELSEQRCEDARGHGVRVVDLDGVAGLELDFINAEQVFEHLPAPADDLSRLVRGLKSGGVIKIAVPSGQDILRRLATHDWKAGPGSRDSLNPVHPMEHINCFSRDALAALGREQGLRTVSPSLVAQFSFVSTSGAVAWRDPKRLLKSLSRPVYNRLSRDNLYMWFQKV